MSSEKEGTQNQPDVLSDEEEKSDEIHFEPIISLPEVAISTNEENEEELVKLRAKLFRFVSHEWKERGTGEIKLLRHLENNSVRVVMRRDKTLKICANHFITPEIQLNPHCKSEKDFNWTCFADFADEQPKSELFAIRFGSIENAQIWKKKFEEAKVIVKSKCSLYNGEEQVRYNRGSSNDDSDTDTEGEVVNKTNDDNEARNKHNEKYEVSEHKICITEKIVSNEENATKMAKAVEELAINKD